MIDLLWNCIAHIPEHMIRDRTRIGNDGFTQFVLAFEDWEFRVYNYEYSDYGNINAADRDNWEDCAIYFNNFDFCLNPTTLAYTRLDIDWERKWMRDDLIDYVREYLADGPRDVEERITKFFRDNIKNLGAKVYQYYK